MQKNQKGFLIVLCLCILSVSGIFGLYKYRKGQALEPKTKVPEQSAQVEETQDSEKEAANSRGTVAQADTEEKEKEKEEPEEEKKTETKVTPRTAKVETEEDLQEIGEAQLANADGASQEETEEEPEEEPAEETSGEVEGSKFAFADDSQILWPVEGDVILNYSMDKSIYFSTLNQFKYHPAIVISADVGTEVLAAARGKVSKIEVNEETGTTITMDLGSGYEAVYGQLKEVAVEEGDTVEAKERLGYISEPTKYYTLEGSNLYFQLLKNEEPVNPLDYME